LAELCHGIAFLETFTREDGIDGDTHGFKRPSGEVLPAAAGSTGADAARVASVAIPCLSDDTAALERPA
jgi:hypothetical protein